MGTDSDLLGSNENNPDKTAVFMELPDLSKKINELLEIVKKNVLLEFREKSLLQSIMDGKQKPEEKPAEKIFFFCSKTNSWKLCKPLGDAFKINLKNILFGETYRGVERNTVIIYITTCSVDCIQKLVLSA